LVLPVPDNATIVTARLDAKDNFALDDSVTTIARTPRAFRVLLVSPGNVFLEQALRLRADFQVDVVAPTAYRGAAAYAMTVFDRFSPPALPDAPFIMVDPPAGSPLAGGPAVGIGRVRASDAGDPLLTNVSLQDVHVARSEDLTASSATFADTDLVGIYTVEQTVAGKVDRSWFAVNLFSDATSQLSPVDHLTLPPARTTAAIETSHHGFLAIWPLIAVLALGLVL